MRRSLRACGADIKGFKDALLYLLLLHADFTTERLELNGR